MKNIPSCFSFVIYSNEYSVARGHRKAMSAAKTTDTPSILKEIDRSPVNLMTSSASPVLFINAIKTRIVLTNTRLSI